MKKRTILMITALLITSIALAACRNINPQDYGVPPPELPMLPVATDDEDDDHDSVNVQYEEYEPTEVYFPAFDGVENPELVNFIPVTIPSARTPAGYAGFNIALDERFTLDSRVGEPGWFRVLDDTGQIIMSIGQIPNVGMTAEEWVHDMIDSLAEDGIFHTYTSPIADFPFFVMPRTVISGEGLEGQLFIRDNGAGGIFYINIMLFPIDWEVGAGLSLLHSLTTFEVVG